MSQDSPDSILLSALSDAENSDWSTVASDDTSWQTIHSDDISDADIPVEAQIELDPFENEFDGLMSLIERNNEQGVKNFFFRQHSSYSPSILCNEWEGCGPPLTYAAEMGRMYTVRTLIQEGADVFLQSTTSDYALPISCTDIGRDEVSLFLLQECGADINSTDNEELLNAAMMALSYDRMGIFWRILTRPGLNLRHVDNEVRGSNLLHCAVIAGNFLCTKKLLLHPGIDVNQQNTLGETPLMVALALPKRKKFALALLDHPLVDANLPNENGLTPLMAACKKGLTSIVQRLVNRDDVDLYAELECGHTAYDLVKRRKGSREIVTILQSVGAHLKTRPVDFEGVADYGLHEGTV